MEPDLEGWLPSAQLEVSWQADCRAPAEIVRLGWGTAEVTGLSASGHGPDFYSAAEKHGTGE